MSNAARRAESEHEAVRKAVVRAEIADWYERDPDEADVSGQFTVYHFQLDALSKGAREYAEQNGVGVDEFRDGPLEQARCLVRRLHNAFINDQWETEAERARRDPTKRLNFWRHERNPLTFVATKQIPYIDRAWVESETGHYLNMPFRSAALDRLLVDVLIGMELYAFANEMLNEPKPILGPPQSPMNLRHPIRVFFVGQLSNALLYLGGAALSVYAGSVGWIGEGWSIGIAVALVAFFLLAFVLALFAMPFYWRNRSKLQREVREKVDAIAGVYFELASSGPISARHIRELAKQAAAKGVVWPSPLFAMLDDIEKRSGRF